MPVIVKSGSTNTVVVDRERTASIVQHRPTVAAVADRRSTTAVAREVQTLQVASPGPQGAKGDTGSGSGSESVTLRAQGAVSALRVVVADGGQARYPDTSNPNDALGVVGITTTAANDGDELQVKPDGELVDAAWSWVPGVVWCGAGGALTQTVPPTGWLLEVGRALSATRLLVDLQTPTIRS